ncbi:type III pantothenate kinase [Noviherbaspirillum soli]|uniref:type III pantothenate kinase n=1 Tax=Noviherbaspirillum soli TaxID=1064518 RepID=UPI00188C6947|nr:type III pantothenate kinase [Noviherbaspirillum soli]
MLLLIDAGNTRVKWALATAATYAGTSFVREELGQWICSGVVEHDALGQLVEVWRGRQVARVVLSNVAGEGMRDKLDQLLLRAFGARPIAIEWFRPAPLLAGVRNGYRNPLQLGADRFASAIGAHALYPGEALIIATCGTATTVDAITPDGVFLGGMILPGLGLMASSLAKNTAQLPQVGSRIEIVTPFADNTTDAIISGCVAAQTGAIGQALAAHAAQYREVRCILSGGAGSMLAPHLNHPSVQVDNLVLIGLQTMVMKQNSSC